MNRAWERIESSDSFVFRNPRVVVKQVKPRTDKDVQRRVEENTRREAHILMAIEREGGLKTPTPKIVRDWSAATKSFAMQRMAGQNIMDFLQEAENKPELRTQYQSIAQDVANFLVEFNDMMRKATFANIVATLERKPDPTDQWAPQLMAYPAVQQNPSWLRLIKTVRDNQDKALYPNAAIIAHNDLGRNILVNPFGVIDFGMLENTPPEWLFRYLPFQFRDVEFSKLIIGCYEEKAGIKIDPHSLCDAMCTQMGMWIKHYDTHKKMGWDWLPRGMSMVEHYLPRHTREARPARQGRLRDPG